MFLFPRSCPFQSEDVWKVKQQKRLFCGDHSFFGQKVASFQKSMLHLQGITKDLTAHPLFIKKYTDST